MNRYASLSFAVNVTVVEKVQGAGVEPAWGEL